MASRQASSRLAECAAMMIAVTRMMLNAEPRAFAGWLGAIADDIEAEAEAFTDADCCDADIRGDRPDPADGPPAPISPKRPN